MSHPFHSSIQRAQQSENPQTSDRRNFITWLVAGTTAATALLAAKPAVAQRSRTRFNRGRSGVTTQALGEEGSRQPRYTTYAIGEEGGRYTTQAAGEEGGRYTTYATGEEGGMTTYALGEEGSNFYRPAPPRLPGSGSTVTTFALGEEG